MHRHREDVHPTGQTFNSPSTISRSGSLSRSSSFRRNLTPTSASSFALKRAGVLAPMRPLSPSPLRPHSPSLNNSGGRQADAFSQYLEHSAPSLSGSSAPSSPFGSPKLLNATAPQFKPNAAASEFRPYTPTALTSPAIPSLSVKMPEMAFKTRSPLGTPSIESPTLWSFQNSPLGTPKFASTSRAVSPAFSGSQNGSYFPNHASAGRLPQSSAGIPNDPWNKLADSSDHSSNSNSGVTPSISTASSEHSYEEISFDPFASSSGTQLQESSGKDQILQSSEDDEEWKIPSVDSLGKSPLTDDGAPRWNTYDDEDDDEFQMLQYKEGQLLKDELLIVEPPQLERPTFAAEPIQQSTDQYSQLPQDVPFPAAMDAGAMPPGLMAYGSGLGESGDYIMTPLDVLYSIFAGSDLQHSDLEDALNRNGWDVDRAMEWIINNPNMPSAPRLAEEQIDRMNMLSLDPSQLSGSGALSPARVHTPGLGGSGSRPMIMSRDSFTRHFGPGGKPQSPRWAAYSNDGSRPGTPRSERGADGYFGAGPTGQASPSTRLCKYYLQGNCLRSDCRFSHDLSKAVCKFWLRGHCLKGEGRCEFLHSVPPHLAQDVAQLRMNSLRVREQEKARWLHRGQPEEERLGFERTQRVEEDFPSLAAATASASNRNHNANKDPSGSRWTQAVKTGRPAGVLPVNNRPSLPRSASASSAKGLHGGQEEKLSIPYSQPRQSGRLALRPPTLLPTVSTGAAVSQMYDEYRASFFKYGEARNKCLVKAASCWQKGDGYVPEVSRRASVYTEVPFCRAGARRWSREAQDWNRQIAREGAIASGQIINERKKVLREAVMSGNRPGRADNIADRQYRGVECGSGLGVCLGVAAATDLLGPEGPRLAVAERTEVALDLRKTRLCCF